MGNRLWGKYPSGYSITYYPSSRSVQDFVDFKDERLSSRLSRNKRDPLHPPPLGGSLEA